MLTTSEMIDLKYNAWVCTNFSISISDIEVEDPEDINGSLQIKIGRDKPLYETKQGLPLYDLAMWFAYNWWRLNYEDVDNDLDRKEVTFDWEMSHRMTAIGKGYIWPDLVFFPKSDENMIVVVDNTNYKSWMFDIEMFKDKVTEFIYNVLLAIPDSQRFNCSLYKLWTVVMEDRGDANMKKQRIVEAVMHKDPEEDL